MNEHKRNILKDAFADLVMAADTNDAKSIGDADLTLHKTIVALSDHRRLAEQYALVEHQVRMYIASTNARLSSRNLVVREHQGMVSAILSGNGDKAEQSAREHNVYAGIDLVSHLERQERSLMKTKTL